MKALPVVSLAAGVLATGVLVLLALADLAHAHCDSMDGHVVASARTALEKGTVTPVLRWVAKEHEAEIREVFARVIAVRSRAPEAAEIADRWFFETLVRVHREGEGAPFTGLKPAGADPGTGIRDADRALETGNADPLLKTLNEAIAEGVKHRLHRAVEARKHADESVEAGRAFVEEYVRYMHYFEGLHTAASGSVHGRFEHPVEEGTGHR